MSAEGESLGKSTYDLDVDLTKFSRNMDVAKGQTSEMDDAMDALAAIADVAAKALGNVKMTAGQGSETDATVSSILAGVSGISDEARNAARELDNVKLTQAQALESKAAADEISEGLDQIGRNADQASRKIDKVKISQSLGSKQIGGTSISLLAAGVGAATVLAPAAGPAVLGLLATLPVTMAGVGGVVGTLALAFDGLSSAIEGNKKAYDKLNPTQQQFVTTVRSMEGELNNLKQVASTDLLPGLTTALHSALTPGTLDAVTTAVGEFATAIGRAGAEWGQYFGSSEFQNIFGPLMSDAARNLDLLSTAALHLFDAIGTLGVAGIPFTNWVMQAIADGSKLADAWVKGEQASGGLASAMSEAEISLRLVVQLLESAGEAVGALGDALYPVSKVAVKDLTDGFDGLAQVIDENKQTIRDLIGTALNGLVESVKLGADGVRLLDEGLGHIVGDKAGIVIAILAIGTAIELSMGPEAEAITGAILAIGYITDHWKQLSTWFEDFGSATEKTFEAMWTGIKGTADLAIYGMLIEVEGLAKGLSDALGWIPGIGGKIKTAMDDVSSFVEQFRKTGVADMETAGSQMGSAWGTAFLSQTQTALNAAAAAGQPVSEHGAGQGAPGTGSMGPTKYSRAQVLSLLLANGVPTDVAQNLATISSKGEDPSGNIAALNNNPSTGDYSMGLFQENFLGKMGVSRVAQYAPQFGKSPTMSVDAFVQWLGQHPSAQAQIAYQIFQSQGYGAWTTAKGLGITGGGTPATANPFGATPAWTSGTAPSAAAKAAATLTASLATDKSKLTTLSKQIATDATSGLIPDSLISGLQARATSLLQAIADGTKKSLPSITQSLAQLKSQIQEGLAQAVDDKKVVALGKQLQDDLDNKLITQSQFTALGTQLGKLNDELTSGLLSPEARRQVEANIAALKKQLALDLNLASEQKTLNSSVAELNQAVTANLFPASVSSTAKSQAKQVGDDIAEGTQAGETAAKSALKQLAATIKQGVADIAKGLSIPASLRSTETGLALGLTGLNDNAGVLVGIGLDNIRLSIQTNLTQQASTLEAEVTILKQQEASTTGALKTAVAAELIKVKAQLTSVQSQIVNNLQATVQTLQSKVSTLLSSVTSEFDSAFDAATQSMLDAVGVTDYQNGAQTPLEAQLAAMQAQDTVTSLNSALTQAQATLATDQADPTVTADQITLDQQAVTQAQRAIDENNLSIKATAERASADSDYASQVKKITAERTASEDAMNKSLADLSDSFENGTGSMSDLNAIAAAYGIQIGTSTIPDFTNLSTATGDLSTAFAALTTYISQITNTPNPGSTPAAIGNANVPGLGDVYIAPGYSLIYENGQPFVIANSLLSTVAGNLGSGYSTTPTGTPGKKPLMADGGIVRRTPGGIDVTVGEGRVDEAIVPLSADPRTNGTLSGGGDIHLHGGTFIGGSKQQVARDLKPYLDRVKGL